MNTSEHTNQTRLKGRILILILLYVGFEQKSKNWVQESGIYRQNRTIVFESLVAIGKLGTIKRKQQKINTRGK